MTDRTSPATRRRRAGTAAAVTVGFALVAAGCGNGVERTAEPAEHDTSAVSGTAGSPTGTRPAPTDATPHSGGSPDSTRPTAQRSDAAHQATSGTESSSPGHAPGHATRPLAPPSTASPTAVSRPTGTESARGTTGSHPLRCSVADLDIGVKQANGGAAAGSRYPLLTFTNTSARTCRISGHAGVSFVGGGNGTKLGHSAKWSGKAKKIALKPGKTAPELVKVGQAGNYDPKKCVPTTADGFRVYPPHSYNSELVKYKAEACQGKGPHQLRAYPVGTKG